MSKKVFLCLDFGTESVRGALITIDGHNLGVASREYTTYFPHNGWAEQKPEELWASMVDVCARLGQMAEMIHCEIEALCIDSTACCLLFLDKNKNPLCNMIMWMDVRAKNEQMSGSVINSEGLKYHMGQQLPSTWMPLRVHWFKNNEEKIYRDSVCVCELLDWVQYKLTGELVHSQNVATLKWYYNSEGEGWPVHLFDEMGISDLMEKISEKVLPSGVVVEKINSRIAAEIGIKGSPVIVEGGADAFVGTLGLGIVDEGDIAVIGGSSHVVLCNTRRRLHPHGMFGAFPDALIPGLGILEGSQTSTGSTLKWYAKNFLNVSRGFAELDIQAEKLPAGSDGVLVLDHWQGNRSPFSDEKSRGVIRGLSLSHTPIHIYRAIMEGVALGTSVIADKLKENNYKIMKMVFGGGIVKSQLWLQIHADTLGLPIHVPDMENAPLHGCAALSAYACGYYDSIISAVRGIKRSETVIQPNYKNFGIYAELKSNYQETYFSLYRRA